jgi:transcriptional regulator with XRE-family HTH domain
MNALRQARIDRGWSQSRALAELRTQAQTLGLSLPAPSSLKTELSRWENGHRVPDAFYQQLFVRVYGRSAASLGISQADLEPAQNTHVTWEESVQNASQLWKRDLDRRDFLKSATFVAAGFAAPSLHALVRPATTADPIRTSGVVSVDATHVTLIQDMTRNFATLDNQHGAGRVRRTAVAYLDGEVSPLLKEGRFNASVGRSLLRAAAELARLVGWMTHDVGRQGLAQRYLVQALHLAEAAGDRALVAETLAAMSQQATYMDEPRAGIDLARGARTLAEREGLSVLVAETLVMEAHGLARAGEGAACASALSAAEGALDRADRSDDPHWIGYFDEAYLSAKFGHCFRELGDQEHAIASAKRSLQMDEGYARGRVFNLTLLAHSHAQAGDVDAACTVGQEAATAATGLQSHRVAHHLRNFRQALAPAAGSSQIAELDAALTPVLNAA